MSPTLDTGENATILTVGFLLTKNPDALLKFLQK